MSSRKEEIEAKRAKLAELRRQRELRQTAPLPNPLVSIDKLVNTIVAKTPPRTTAPPQEHVSIVNTVQTVSGQVYDRPPLVKERLTFDVGVQAVVPATPDAQESEQSELESTPVPVTSQTHPPLTPESPPAPEPPEIRKSYDEAEIEQFVQTSARILRRTVEEPDVLTDYAAEDPSKKDDVPLLKQFSVPDRAVTSIDWSNVHQELLLASYSSSGFSDAQKGKLNVFNTNYSHPEYELTAPSEILTAKFSPTRSNIIVGGLYSGRVCLWDLRASHNPVLSSTSTSNAHFHPVYSLEFIGETTYSILTCSTDGTVCTWADDRLDKPLETLSLSAPSWSRLADIAPTTMAVPSADQSFFVVGTEDGSVFPCNRRNAGGFKAGIDPRVSYKSHYAPITSMDFYHEKSYSEIKSLLLTTSMDWSIKMWKILSPTADDTAIKAEAAIVRDDPNAFGDMLSDPRASVSSRSLLSSAGTDESFTKISPIRTILRSSIPSAARWAPTKPSFFAVVDCQGQLEIWDISSGSESPSSRISVVTDNDLPAAMTTLAWDKAESRRITVGATDGMLRIYDVSSIVSKPAHDLWSFVQSY
ncbi:hypothetical protein CANCADRAFT_29990 [Tortispora caseinolytica NRRL Y-17796]|uniref:Dynein intermediate chain n=1 Tax=Tortispora caseinolytica NRRL Y-17796 TaxID=767744 RepID=A0A1E4TIP9_9ASCO|nr:hypothetical protein CANCADRAFT_29990 [Tortispora caseinolytica NRRL Y-17796]